MFDELAHLRRREAELLETTNRYLIRARAAEAVAEIAVRAFELQRMWINQPSGHDAFHHLNQTNVLAITESFRVHRIYFLSGPIISMQILSTALSKGWTGGLGDAP